MYMNMNIIHHNTHTHTHTMYMYIQGGGARGGLWQAGKLIELSQTQMLSLNS